MLRFILNLIKLKNASHINLNTTLVKVHQMYYIQQQSLILYLNTTLVKVHQEVITLIDKEYSNLNTTLVKVHHILS